ncbi:unnamed protein product, partial [Gulo gulo]
ERNYVCTECWQAFRQKSELITHQKIHTAEKPHGNSICGKSFAREITSSSASVNLYSRKTSI